LTHYTLKFFDSTGTLVGVSHRAGLLQDGKLPRLKKALFADSTAQLNQYVRLLLHLKLIQYMV
jgi:xanthine/uracil/vitamin C permease (AzgA family)